MTDNTKLNSNFLIIENADQEIEMLCMIRAKKIYGEPLSPIIAERLNTELSIIKQSVGASAYLIAHKLVKKSNEAGYMVGSSGMSVSSLVSYLLGITEFDPLEYNLPFEVFLGLNGEKRPDFDLHFAPEQQEEIVKYLISLFGEGRVVRAGANRVCCTTGEKFYGANPGKYFISPNKKRIEDFTSVISVGQEPHTVLVTQAPSHELEQTLLDVGILPLDGLTIINKLETITGVSAKVIPLDDEKTLSLFRNADTEGIPRFDEELIRNIIKEVKPKTFEDFVKISGLSLSSNLWLENAKMLIEHGVASFHEVIAHRDEVMINLVEKGVSREEAYAIMERVRSGRGLSPEEESLMCNVGVPSWYIASCKKIEYLFPKGHSLTFTMMAFRIGWYKAHYSDVFEKVMRE